MSKKVKQVKKVTKKAKKIKKPKEKKIEDIYIKMSPHEHILTLPDTYIGSVEPDKNDMWVYNNETCKIEKKEIEYVPGLYKIFDEILVNARDHSVRDKKCTKISVVIDQEEGMISVYNNGTGIPVEIHKTEKMYVPEMIFGHLLTSSNYHEKGKIVGGKNGYGAKCIRHDTTVPLWNGDIKKASDIKKRDKLIGDDGTVRTVKNVIKNNGPMYEIKQSNGDTYYVNDQHTLTLHMPDHKKIFWNNTKNGWTVLWWNNNKKCINVKTIVVSKPEKILCNPPNTDKVKTIKKQLIEFCKTINDDNVFDIDIQDYLKLNKTTKKRLAGIQSSLVKWPKQNVSLDPYVLGLWLGDEMSCGYQFTCNASDDKEILKNFRKKGFAPLKKHLDKYNLTNNKHIPSEYLINDKDTRLKVLAGIIDSDGSVSRNGTRIVICQSLDHKKIVDGIVYLSRSLGFNCKVNINRTSWTYKGIKKTGSAYKINISGNDLENIPTKLPRKKCCSTISNNMSKSTGYLTITPTKDDDYIGIEIDGNKRFIINDFTVTHNCANIYSTEFIVETVCSKNKKYYKQVFTNNMYDVAEPEIKKSKKPAYTKITFYPDFKRFNLTCLTDDMVCLLKKRVFDLAACTGDKVEVSLNDKVIPMENFSDYIKMFYDDDDESHSEPVYEECENKRWRIGAVFDPSGYTHVSYANGICTFQGGTHVDHVTRQIVDSLAKHIKEKNKNIKLKNSQIRENLTVFIDCVIEDPSFSSQTKEFLTSKVSTYGSRCELSETFIKQFTKSGIVETVVDFAKLKELADMKKSDGKKRTSLRGIPKLEDADLAGSRKSVDTRLILTEGDSAKTYAMSGRSVIGTAKYGVFPLKGKLLNVREASAKQLLNNEEIKNIKAILGLRQGKKYTSAKELRYGGIIILVDQDPDGSHIKGLLINFIHFFWPSLLKIPNFVQCMATPIVKAFKKTDKKKKNPKIFYTLTEYEAWVKTTLKGNTSKYIIKYYKGLGTSTDKEAKEAFNTFETSLISYVWSLDSNKQSQLIEDKSDTDEDEDDEDEDDDKDNDEDDNNSSEANVQQKDECSESINLAFAKTLADKRKLWLKKYDKNIIIENDIKQVPVKDFINKELIHFSNYDVQRSIPSIDGLKPSQRKVVYASFLRKLEKGEIKVSQLAGFISEKTEYHHGEVSLQGTIVNMAQDFVGSNNINILTPNGNFGTRRSGGKDASSARYIFTQLNELAPYIFRNEDNCVLKHCYEDGRKIEPVFYPTVIPVALINGVEGIGTGFSTDIPSFNPLEVIDNIKHLLKKEDTKQMKPWYYGFTGRVIKKDDTTFESIGKYKILNDSSIHVTELPVKMWSDTYKEFLESKLTDDPKTFTKDKFITEFKNHSGNNSIDFKIKFARGKLQQLIKSNAIEKKMKLRKTIKISNMHLYNSKNVITKYNTVDDILCDFFTYRYGMYVARKTYYVNLLKNEMEIAKYKKQYIEDILNETIIVARRKRENIIQQLEDKCYPRLSHKVNALKSEKSYDYLTSMLLFSLTDEKIKELENIYKDKKEELERYEKLTVEEIWESELDDLLQKYKKWVLNKEEEEEEEADSNGKKKRKSKKGKIRVRKKKIVVK
jgi:DNA topoisomerase II